MQLDFALAYDQLSGLTEEQLSYFEDQVVSVYTENVWDKGAYLTGLEILTDFELTEMYDN